MLSSFSMRVYVCVCVCACAYVYICAHQIPAQVSCLHLPMTNAPKALTRKGVCKSPGKGMYHPLCTIPRYQCLHQHKEQWYFGSARWCNLSSIRISYHIISIRICWLYIIPLDTVTHQGIEHAPRTSCHAPHKHTDTHTERHTNTRARTHTLRTAKQEQSKKRGWRKLLRSCRAALHVFRSAKECTKHGNHKAGAARYQTWMHS